MAVHSSLGRRNPSNGGSFDASMTVAAIDAVIAHVMLVAELHGLLTGNVLSRHIGRARHREHGYERHSDEKEGRKHTEPRDEIGTAMKNLCHVCSALCGGALRGGSCGQAVPPVRPKAQTRIMLDAIVSNKTFGNATFRQFVIRGFQNFRGLLFAACSSEKSSPPQSPLFRSRMLSTECRCDPLGLTDSHAKRNHFPRKFPNGTGGRHGGFFSGHGSSPSPTREC